MAGPVVELAQPAAQLAAHLGVERAERLVEQQHPRLDGQRAGQRHALALAAGELGGMALAEAVELHELEQVARRGGRSRGRRPLAARPHAQAEGDVLGHRHVAEQGVVLEDEADAALAHRHARGVLVAEQDAAGARHLEAGDEAQERRLARARRAEQRQELAGGDLEVETGNRRRRAEGLDQSLGGDRDGRVAPVAGLSAGGRRRGRRRGAIRGGSWRPG